MPVSTPCRAATALRVRRARRSAPGGARQRRRGGRDLGGALDAKVQDALVRRHGDLAVVEVDPAGSGLRGPLAAVLSAEMRDQLLAVAVGPVGGDVGVHAVGHVVPLACARPVGARCKSAPSPRRGAGFACGASADASAGNVSRPKAVMVMEPARPRRTSSPLAGGQACRCARSADVSTRPLTGGADAAAAPGGGGRRGR